MKWRQSAHCMAGALRAHTPKRDFAPKDLVHTVLRRSLFDAPSVQRGLSGGSGQQHDNSKRFSPDPVAEFNEELEVHPLQMRACPFENPYGEIDAYMHTQTTHTHNTHTRPHSHTHTHTHTHTNTQHHTHMHTHKHTHTHATCTHTHINTHIHTHTHTTRITTHSFPLSLPATHQCVIYVYVYFCACRCVRLCA